MFLKTYKKALHKAIIDAIDFEGYDIAPQTDDQKILALIEIARSEAGHEIARKGLHAGIEYWLSGLPSCINLPVYHGEIVKVWELYRRRPVKHGLQSSHYFDMVTFESVHPTR